ncbi:MAG: hypothetical protein A3A24_03990 [Candidatus Buchananbacteria bacterium RIFCSPLOWO2_01_FULL_46_12]|uniref:L-asparaginase N-terminal domain-containing protein n=1 Tax=Candidatus Buchananbacteria bacterium RIFCSPLOWO2_01_FULL_46_12 TaxID=1797546 RepID=A0A1G1YSE4_9BACT|nr:MAG: hypothetical protein A3A24_03990 [Candidatus Buchananbacteria bacterium RIFCSPLOWO2_01_FULL_46_12]
MGKSVVRVIATGGTIDEDHSDPVTGKSRFTHSHVPEMLVGAGVMNDVTFELLMLKDSSDINEGDRKKILERCLSCPEKRIVITHGTNTMVETAVMLGKNIFGKTVVLVGAFVPFTRKGSDAVPNLRYAVAKARQLPPGVYVAMNGQVFSWDNVRKNKKGLIFESS